MKVMYKLVSAVTFSLLASTLSLQASAAEILGGGSNAAGKLIADWANAKPGNKANPVKFNNAVASNDLSALQNGKIDFAILDTPLSEADLAKFNVMQFPFALSGVSIVVNLQNTLSGTIKLDGATLGKIFSGEITSWDDSAITALNPKHDLPNKPIMIIHSGESSSDYSVINSYLANVNEKWKAGDVYGRPRMWPSTAIATDSYATRIATIKNTPYSIGYLPMQYLPQPSLSNVHIKNKDGNFVGLSDTSIMAATATVNVNDGQSASLSLVNKGGNASWPISNFTFIVINKDRVNAEETTQILGVINYGLRLGSLKPTIHNYVAIPEAISKAIWVKIDPLTTTASKSSTARSSQNNAEELAAKKREEELNRQRAEARANASQDERSKAEERNKMAKQLADEQAREQAIKEARAAKLAAEEAIKAANAAKLEAEKLAEKNRQIAKAEKEKADREQAEKDRIERARVEKERAIQLRNQKDEDPLEAYRRTGQ